MFNLREYRSKAKHLSDYLPWAALIGPGLVLQKDALLQKTYAYRGADLASSSDQELMARVAQLNNALKRLGTGWALFSEAQRFENNEYPSSEFDNPAAWLMDTERREFFSDVGSHFESCYFLTFTWQMPSTVKKKVARFFYTDPVESSPRKDLEADIDFFLKTVREIVSIMESVFIEVAELDDDQTLSYLHSTISTNRHPVRSPDIPMYLDALLTDQAFESGDPCILGDAYLKTLSFTGFPIESFPGILEQLNHLQIEYRWVNRFLFMDKDDAKRELKSYQKTWWQKRKDIQTLIKEEATKEESQLEDTEASSMAVDAKAAQMIVGEGLVAFGFYTCTVSVWHEDLAEVTRRIELIKTEIQRAGFVVKDETWNSAQAWFGSLPGHVYANVRRPMINTLNLAHLMPISAPWAGDRHNEHLLDVIQQAEPHVMCSTEGSTPFRLNLNVGDVGHTFIAGDTGAGKSVLASILALQWLRYRKAQVVFFDKNSASRGATLAAGGQIYEPGNDDDDRSTTFQPLRQIHIKSERMWAAQFIENLLIAQNIAITASIKAEIMDTLEAMEKTAFEERTLSHFSSLAQLKEIRDGVRPYTLQGAYGQLFDSDHDDFGNDRWSMIEMGWLMEKKDEAIVPALDYLFHRLDQRFDGRPTLLVIDEGWMFLAHPVFRDRLQEYLKTLRSKNVYVVFLTQELADAANSPILSTILKACKTQIFLPDKKAESPGLIEHYLTFGLTHREIHLLTQWTEKRDYYYKSPKGQRVFDLNLGPVALAFAGLTMKKESDAQLMNRLQHAVAPEARAGEILRYKGLDWAAELYDKGLVAIQQGHVLAS